MLVKGSSLNEGGVAMVCGRHGDTELHIACTHVIRGTAEPTKIITEKSPPHTGDVLCEACIRESMRRCEAGIKEPPAEFHAVCEECLEETLIQFYPELQ